MLTCPHLICDIKLDYKHYTRKEKWVNYLVKKMIFRCDDLKEKMGEQRFIMLFKRNLLTKINNAWTIHLTKMNNLQSGVFYRQYSNNNPLTAFKEEGAIYFNEMIDKFSYETTYAVFMSLRRFEEYYNQNVEKEKEA